MQTFRRTKTKCGRNGRNKPGRAGNGNMEGREDTPGMYSCRYTGDEIQFRNGPIDVFEVTLELYRGSVGLS